MTEKKGGCGLEICYSYLIWLPAVNLLGFQFHILHCS